MGPQATISGTQELAPSSERIAIDGPGVTPDQVAALTLPALVIGHGRDLLHPFDHAERLAGLISGARLVEITPKATSLDRYVLEFRAALRSFLTALPTCDREPVRDLSGGQIGAN